MVWRILSDYGLKSRHDRLREAGMLTHHEMAARLGIVPGTLKQWRLAGLVRGHPFN